MQNLYIKSNNITDIWNFSHQIKYKTLNNFSGIIGFDLYAKLNNKILCPTKIIFAFNDLSLLSSHRVVENIFSMSNSKIDPLKYISYIPCKLK